MSTPYLDAHIHLWRRDDGESFWMREKIPALDRDFTEDDLRAQRARCGVGGAIVVQAMHNVGESRRLRPGCGDLTAAFDAKLVPALREVDLYMGHVKSPIKVGRAETRPTKVRP